MLTRSGMRTLALVGALGVAALGACTNSGSDEEGTNQAPAMSGRNGPATGENPVGSAPNQAGQTRAERAGAIGPGSAAGTAQVNAVTQSTQTQVDSTPDLHPSYGPQND